MAKIDLQNYEIYAESEHYIAYLEKQGLNSSSKTKKMIVYHKARNMCLQCELNQALLDFIFNSRPISSSQNPFFANKQR